MSGTSGPYPTSSATCESFGYKLARGWCISDDKIDAAAFARMHIVLEKEKYCEYRAGVAGRDLYGALGADH